MLVVNTKETFLLNLHQNRVHFPAERNAFVLHHQHGRRDVTCKPAIANVQIFKLWLTAAKNATVGGDLNFRFRVLLKGAVSPNEQICHTSSVTPYADYFRHSVTVITIISGSQLDIQTQKGGSLPCIAWR